MCFAVWYYHNLHFLFLIVFSDYMDGMDCGKTLDLGGAIVFSHHFYMSQLYNHSVRCTLTFKAQNAGWKLMLRVLELDIPDRRYNGYCNDALWVYDADSIYTKAMVSRVSVDSVL